MLFTYIIKNKLKITLKLHYIYCILLKKIEIINNDYINK